MIEEGEKAPMFDLPGVRDGEITQVAGDEFLGESIVVLAFYPGDFNPACDGAETGLDELDLFTMQKDVDVLALSGDSVYSHLAFADEYSLHMPLLTDTDGSIAAAYGVAVDDVTAGYRTQRAVVVVDHAGVVQYTWRSDKPGAVPNAEVVRDAINEIGDEDTAQSRYRIGYARYMEGRRAFTSAMKAFEQEEWMIAQTDFTQAADEFDEAGEEFNTAIRFAEADETRTYFERAEKKAEALWRAADWLSQSAKAFSSGEGARGESLRSDAESPLETARDLHDPPDPDDFPPETDPAEETDDSEPHFVPEEEEEPAASLDADLDAAVDEQPEATPPDGGPAVTDVPAYGNSEPLRTRSRTPTPANARPRSYPEQDHRSDTAAESEETDESEIDDEELEAITAALEEQSEKTSEPSEPDEDNVVPDEVNPDYSIDSEDSLSESADSPSESAEDSLSESADSSSESAEDSLSESADSSSESLLESDDHHEDSGVSEADETDQPADDDQSAAADQAVGGAEDGEEAEGADESVVDEIYTGVVDVSSDVIEQVGGEKVDLDSEGSDGTGDESEESTDSDGEIDLDLTDPETDDAADESDEDETDVSTGDHGVPDSL